MLNIRLRRGSASANDSLTLPLGALSIDEDVYTLRLHDGQTVGGHPVPLPSSFSDLQAQIDTLGITDISALEAALSAKAAIELLGVSSGIATLNDQGQIRSSQLPSFVDDILEYPTQEDFPATGVLGKLYVAQDSGFVYRWESAGNYARVASQPTVTDDIAEGEYSLYFTEQRVRDLFSGTGDVQYDTQTGNFDFEQSVDSVNGQEGAVVVDQGDLGLDLVQDYPEATVTQAQAMLDNASYMTPGLMRDSSNTVGFFEEDQLGWYIEGGILEIPTGPGPKELLHGDSYLGYYGTVLTTELFTREQMSSLLGVDQYGAPTTGDFLWFKFSYNERTLFIPSKPLRYGVSWNELYRLGLAFAKNSEAYHPDGEGFNQNRYMELEEFGRFMVRLPYGRTGDQTTDYVNSGAEYDPPITHGSEWNELMYRVAATANDADPSVPVGEWAQYSNAELGLNGGAGSASLTANIDESGNVVYRGYSYIDRTTTTTYKNDGSMYAWRPVLEYFMPSQLTFEISEITYDTYAIPGYVGNLNLSEEQVADYNSFTTVQSLSMEPIQSLEESSNDTIESPTQTEGEVSGTQPVLSVTSTPDNYVQGSYVGGSDATGTVPWFDVVYESASIEPITAVYQPVEDPTIIQASQLEGDVSGTLPVVSLTADTEPFVGYIGNEQVIDYVRAIEITLLEVLNVAPVSELSYETNHGVNATEQLTGEVQGVSPAVEPTFKTSNYTPSQFIGRVSVSDIPV